MIFDDNNIQYTNLHGIVGTTSMPDNKYSLTYFQTSVSSRVPGSAQYKFLKELIPIRDRLNISEIQTMDDVLQRDIDDARIARDMIPYLMDTIDKPVFFPSILVVLMPRKNLTTGKNDYPKPSTSTSGITSYGNFWSLKRHKDNSGNEVNVADLKINLDDVHPIVIDGQHRTTAFRWLADIKSSGTNLHDNFYTQLAKPESFKSDLPVTILWFTARQEEYHEELDIKKISRDLFTDINQSSQQISQSRNILMNNSSPSAFITRRFYDFVSQHKFSVKNQLTLFHTGFDFPFDASSRKSWAPNSLFIPEIFDLAMQALFFGNPKEQSDLKIDKSSSRAASAYKSYFEYFVGAGLYNQYIETRKDIEGFTTNYFKPQKKTELDRELKNSFFPALYDFLDSNGFYQAIMNGFLQVQEGFDAKLTEPYNNSSNIDTWNTMYLSGEGVYYTVINSKNPGVSQYKVAAGEINKEFFDFADNELNVDVRSLLKQIQSVAYIQGYISSVNAIVQDHENYSDALSHLSEINKKINWIELATLQLALMDTYVSKVDPKSWPSFRNIYLRFVAEHDDTIYQREVHYLEARITWNIAYNQKLVNWCDRFDVKPKDARRVINTGNWSSTSPINKVEWESILNEAKDQVQSIFEDSIGRFKDFDVKSTFIS